LNYSFYFGCKGSEKNGEENEKNNLFAQYPLKYNPQNEMFMKN